MTYVVIGTRNEMLKSTSNTDLVEAVGSKWWGSNFNVVVKYLVDLSLAYLKKQDVC